MRAMAISSGQRGKKSDRALREAKASSEGLFRRPGFLVRRLHQIYVSLYLQECQQFGTTPVQSSVLQVLLLKPGLDQISLANEIGLDRTTASDVLTRLAKRGLIERKAADEDRRLKRAYLTVAGTKMVSDMQSALEAAHGRLIQALPSEAAREDFINKLILLIESNNDQGRAVLTKL
jgi:DNA-binding MarR family transcriptional regulator